MNQCQQEIIIVIIIAQVQQSLTVKDIQVISSNLQKMCKTVINVLQFTDEEIEAQGCQVTCLRSHSGIFLHFIFFFSRSTDM